MDVASLFEMAKDQHNQGNWSDALQLYDKVLTLDSQRSDVWIEAHICLLQLKRFDEAMTYLDKAVEAKPDVAASVEHLRNNVARQRLVFQEMKAEQVDDIRPLLALIRNKDDSEVKHSIGNLIFDPIYLSKVLWNAKLMDSAISQLVNALTDDNDDVRFSVVAKFGIMKHAEAFDGVLRALEDSSPMVRMAAAIALGDIGNPQAKSALQKAAEADPDNRVQEKASASLLKLG